MQQIIITEIWGEAANWNSGATSINHTVILAALYETSKDLVECTV